MMEVSFLDWWGHVVGAIFKAMLLIMYAAGMVLFTPFKVAYGIYASIVDTGRWKSFKSILITGASSGIGAEFARQYAKPGVRLVLTARRVEKLDAVKKECEALGAKVDVFAVDVADGAAMAKTIATADDAMPLDLVLANAGVHETGFRNETSNPLVNASQMTTEVNVMGVVNTLAPAISRMQARGTGQLAILASVVGLVTSSDPWWTSYMASKVWARAFGIGLRGALKPFGVGVTILCPGYVASEMIDELKETKAAGTAHALPADYAVRKMSGAIARNAGEFFVPGSFALMASAVALNVIPTFLLDYLPKSVTTLTQLPTSVEEYKLKEKKEA